MRAETELPARRPGTGVAIVLVCACFAGCDSSGSGGGNNDTGGTCVQTTIQNCGSGPWDPFGIALLFAWVGGQCSEEVRCESQALTDLSGGIVSNNYVNSNWSVGFVPDREPNDSTGNALPVVLDSGGAIFLDGTVNDATDAQDTVALAVRSANNSIVIYLCSTPQTCTLPFLQTDEIYIDLYDQAGTLIQTTSVAQSANGHSISLLPVQGAGYFVAVVARDTGGADFEYRLNIVD
jgi:hypothetical protein